MVRDKLRSKKYFNQLIEDEEQRITKFTNVIRKVIAERGEVDDGVESGYNYLFGAHFRKLKALYSSGAPLEKIKDFVPEVIDIAEKTWDSEGDYIEMVYLLSIGYMLNIESSQMERLKQLIIKDGVEDYLIDFLLHSYDTTWEIRTTSLHFGHPYPLLHDIIQDENKEKALSLLKTYLEVDWYDAHDDMGWYDTHKKEDELIYSGYWSFECGAIAKTLGLDDSSLKDTPYYPYDMVHFIG
ncbi:DUF1911 domain-containing protein [Pseudogracilibacillus sp. SE30717A]|uniref:PoNi-like cognate immunity protein n=1 Tax=Pseudogracilibacillus sp. SE30717A TaxID=3098293 RepID=UPI00300DD509